MQSDSESSPAVAQAILAANRKAADQAGPDAVRRLAVDPETGQRWVLNTAMGAAPGDGGTDPRRDFECHAAGYTELAVVETRHPIRVGYGPTVAEVLAQLADELREQVVGVEILDSGGDAVLSPTEPKDEIDSEGWAVFRTRLYRASRHVDNGWEVPFAVPDSAFHQDGMAPLDLYGFKLDGRWKVLVQVGTFIGEGPGELIGVLRTEEATHPGAYGDVIEALRQAIVAGVRADTKVGYFMSLTDDGPPEERDAIIWGQMILVRGVPPTA